MRNLLISLLFLCLLLGGCAEQTNQTIVEGTIKYGQDNRVFIEKKPIHYKYADPRRYSIDVDSNNKFRRAIPLDSAQIVQFYIHDQSYPIYLQPNITLSVQTNRANFPSDVSIQGYNGNWNTPLQNYLAASDSLKELAGPFEDAFHRARNDTLLVFYKKRIVAAKKFLEDTPFTPLIEKAEGEFLVKRLEYLKDRIYYQDASVSRLDTVRETILQQAKDFDFFTYQSLRAQRAGIYDFANAYALSFGIEKKVEKQKNQDLLIYDVKQLAYSTIDSLKRSLLSHIDGRRALAYAEMHLVAETIGEQSIETATPPYKRYMDKYGDYPAYTSFLKEFYQKRKNVSPGQPAVPFSLPSASGENLELGDYRGKYVLLDFWASWCIPCLDEFPHMKKLYRQYPRSEFEIIGISIEKDSARWQSALQRFDLPWPQVYGGKGFEQATFKQYQGGGIPFYILVDPQGQIERYNDVRPSFNLPRVLDSLIRKREL